MKQRYFGMLGRIFACVCLAACNGDYVAMTAPTVSAGSGAQIGTAGASGVSGAGPSVRVEDGELEGAVNSAGSIRSFLGIPYAKPPVGPLRWQAPQKTDPWTAVRSAKEFGGRCPQLESTVLQNAASDSEDCLYLNVWSPAPAPAAPLPVMFWIHGGGNVNGSANEPVPFVNSGLFYSGEFLAARGVVVVSINYRLGALGFFAHEGLASEGTTPGNQGLWDQQFALSWVKRNIASFGGDPNNVTIFGESAGSLDVCFHVASPKSRGLFHRAISESGGCTTIQDGVSDALDASTQLAAALGCSGADSLACLRQKTPAELLNALPSASGDQPFGPIMDAAFLPEQPRVLFDRGDVAKVPYILGSNTDEGTLFTGALTSVTTDDAYRAVIAARFPDAVDQILQEYPVSDYMSAANPYVAALARVFGDGALVCSTWDVAVRAAKAGLPTYLYNFDIPVNIGDLGATHGSELVYVFGTSPSLTPEQKQTSTLIQSYWTNLAKTGDPNAASLLAWPPFSLEADKRVNLSVQPSVVDNFRREECTFWQSLYDKGFVD